MRVINGSNHQSDLQSEQQKENIKQANPHCGCRRGVMHHYKKERNMILSNLEFQNYISAHLRLLHYCYCKRNNLGDKLTFNKFVKKSFESKVEGRNYFNENVSILTEYFEYNKQIPESAQEILLGFNRKISSKFVVLKQLKNYAIFLDVVTDKFYAVVALSDPLPIILESLPVMVETTILPFNNKIIYDGFLIRHMYIGRNMESNLLNQYRVAMENKMIIKMIE